MTNQDVRIHYQVKGEGPPLVLHHFSLGSWENWNDFGYLNVLKQDYQLIMLDARGHGASDKPYDPDAYDISLYVSDVTSVLDELQIPKAHFFGYSLGGGTGFGLAKYAPDRVNSLILGGSHPYAVDSQAHREQMTNDPIGYLALGEQAYSDYMTPELIARFRANDFKAQASRPDRPSLADVLPTMHMPTLLFAGETDPIFSKVQAGAKDIPNSNFFSVPGCDHILAHVRSDLVLPYIASFLDKHST